MLADMDNYLASDDAAKACEKMAAYSNQGDYSGKEKFFWRNRGNSLLSSHSSHGFLGGILATVLLLCLVEAIGETELQASGVFPLLLLESHVAVGTVGLLALGVEDVVHVQA